jgi:uncharacterized protein YndB with AHSA1/START domain
MSKSTDATRSRAEFTLVVSRTIDASPERLFEAWTRADQLRQWWGPKGVTCTAAEVDLRVGGRYRIANQLPDGRVVWISGVFESIEPPRLLVYSWGFDSDPQRPERVTVALSACATGTEVTVTHECIVDAVRREGHEQGWVGCLHGLQRHLENGPLAGGLNPAFDTAGDS